MVARKRIDVAALAPARQAVGEPVLEYQRRPAPFHLVVDPDAFHDDTSHHALRLTDSAFHLRASSTSVGLGVTTGCSGQKMGIVGSRPAMTRPASIRRPRTRAFPTCIGQDAPLASGVGRGHVGCTRCGDG